MAKDSIKEIDNESKREMMLLDNSDSNFFGKSFSVINDIAPYRKHFVFDVPMHSDEHRLMLITSGSTVHSFNFAEYKLVKGSLVLMPANYIFSILKVSDDFNAKILSFATTAHQISAIIGYKLWHMNLDKNTFSIVSSYIELIGRISDARNTSSEDVEHLVISLLYYLRKNSGEGLTPHFSYSETIANNFLCIIGEQGAPVRNVSYYAKRLNVSENHLHQSVRKETKSTVMQWVNRKTVAYIKMFLADKQKNYSLAEIAEKVNLGNAAQLSRFFKKETGQTPAEYRKSVNNGQ